MSAAVGVLPLHAADYASRGGQSVWRGKQRVTTNMRSRAQKVRRKDILVSMEKDVRPVTFGNIYSDLYVVERQALVDVVLPWVERKNRDALGNGNDFESSLVIGGCQYLASELGCHPDVFRKLFSDTARKWVNFNPADAILVAIGMEHALHDGRVESYVNPRLSRAKWCERAKEQGDDNPSLSWLLGTHPSTWSA